MAKAQAPKPGFLTRAAQAVRYTITGASTAWMPPMQPLQPLVADVDQSQVKGRAWDYPVAWNLNYIPRANEPIDFPRLKFLAEWCPLLRTVIETRKDQVESLEWDVIPKEVGKGRRAGSSKEYSGKIKEIKDFFETPDKEHNWAQWVRALLEQHFVLDAVTLYRQQSRAKKLFALQMIDGATIKVMLDGYGRTPKPPEVAYQQILKGLPAVDYSTSGFNAGAGPTFTSGEMIYFPKNVRADRAYGYPPVAQIVDYVDMAMGRVRFQRAWFTEGNVPDSFMEAGVEMTADQIAAMQLAMDSLFAGNLEQRRRVWWVPAGTKYTPMKDAPLKDEMDEWLARIICFAFSISPTPFIKQMNRATAQSQQEVAAAEGLQPTMMWLKRLMDRIIAEDFGAPYLEFEFNTDVEFDPSKKAVSDNLLVRAGIKTIDEVRDELGLEPQGGAATTLLIATPQGYVPVDPQEAADLRAPTTPPFGGSAPPGKQLPNGKKPPEEGVPAGATGPGKKPPPKAGGAEATAKSAERSLYVYRPLLNEHEVHEWAKAAGVSADVNLHVAVAESLLPVDWRTVPESPAPLQLIEGGERRLFKRDDGALVLEFDSPELTARWGEIAGATGLIPPDATYRPQVIITFQGTTVDLERTVQTVVHKTVKGDDGVEKTVESIVESIEKLAPYGGPLLFGAEEMGSFADGAFDGMTEKSWHGEIDDAAYEAHDDPSRAQRDAGNYDKGHFWWNGLNISIETPRGVKRKGQDAVTGQKWKVRMPAHYGYVRGTESADGMQVDVYFGKHPKSDDVWVVNQQHIAGDQAGQFDEVKAFLGYNTVAEVVDDYVTAHDDGQGEDRIQSIAHMTVEEFKDWLNDGDTGAAVHKVYHSVSELPKAVRDKIKNPKKRRQWMHTWNSIYQSTGDESRAFAGAWSVAQKEVNTVTGLTHRDQGTVPSERLPRADGHKPAEGEEADKDKPKPGDEVTALVQDRRTYTREDPQYVQRAAKKDKSEVGYHDGAKGDRCEICRHMATLNPSDFESSSCELVKGLVTLDGWCELFEEGKPAAKGVAEHRHGPFGGETTEKAAPKGYHALRPLASDTPRVRGAIAEAKAVLARGLHRVQASVVRQVRARLGKAGPEDEAQRLAQEIADALDLGDLEVVVDDMSKLMGGVGQEAGRLALAQVGVQESDIVNQVDERAATWAADRAAELVGMRYDEDGNLVPSASAEMRIDETTRDMVRAIIGDGLADGKTSSEIADDLASMKARPFSEDRAQIIADAEIRRSHSAGSVEGYKGARDAGVDVLKEWLVADAPCEVCEGNADDGPIPLDEDFSSGDPYPGAHPHCECVVIPWVRDTSNNEEA